jgi:Peptidase inhibitor I78 family
VRVHRAFLTTVIAASWAAVACGGRAPVPPTRPLQPPTASCDATKAQFAIGQAASSDLLERARRAAGAGSARFLRPNQPITMEYLGSRLNLNLNERDVVNGASCG